MVRSLLAVVVVGVLADSAPVSAQSGAGGLNGYVKDEQGGVLPGVTVTARSAELQWNTGANQLYSPNYLSRFNRTSSRQLQLNFKYRF